MNWFIASCTWTLFVLPVTVWIQMGVCRPVFPGVVISHARNVAPLPLQDGSWGVISSQPTVPGPVLHSGRMTSEAGSPTFPKEYGLLVPKPTCLFEPSQSVRLIGKVTGRKPHGASPGQIPLI